MKVIDIIIMIISSSLTAWADVMCYKTMVINKEIHYNLKTMAFIILEGVIFIITTYYKSSTLSTIIINLFSLSFLYYIIFRDDYRLTLLKAVIVYIPVVFYEIIFSIITVGLKVVDVEMFNRNLLLKLFFSAIVMISSYFTLRTNTVKKFTNKINMVNQKNIEIIIITATIVSLIILEIKYVDKFSNSIYISNLLLTFCLAAVVTTSIYNNNRAKKETEKNETLLEFITKYEKIIDEGRINKHEMLNNLLILKGYQNKNTKRYNEILNGFIDIYSKGSISIRNLHKLPNGLKGLIYYKIKESDFSNVKISVNISNNTSISLNKISAKDYVRLCKIVGIVLDNALEGAIESVEKSVLIESYTIENKLVINIINSCKGKIDLNKISKLNYSSKGKERGIGLYLANKLMDEINIISLKQTLEKKLFITSITVLQ